MKSNHVLGNLKVNEENCQELMAAADMFRMSDVLEACCSFLEKQLHPSNCIGKKRYT